MPFSATRDLWLVLKARDEGTRALRSFSRDIRMVGDSVRQANLLAARSALQNHMAMQRMTGASKNDIMMTQQRISTIDKEIGSMRVRRAEMEEQRVSAQKMSTAFSGIAGISAAAGTALLATGILGTMAMGKLVQSAIDYEKQSALTRTQTDKFAVSLKDIEDAGLRIANKIPVAFGEIQPALYDIFSSMSIGLKDAEVLEEAFAKAAVAGQTSVSAASRATIGIMNAFQLPVSSVNHLLDVQFQLVRLGIGTYEEWTQRIGLVTPSAVRAGQSVEMMAAALAASTRMGISAARSATAVSRAMDALSNPVAVKNMQQLGVAALDAKGNFRPMIDILSDLRSKLKGLPQGEAVKKLLAVFKGAGGTIEARRFLQNMVLQEGNLEMFRELLDKVTNEAGSFEQAYAVMADTAAAKSQLLANKWDILKVSAGKALVPVFLKVVEFLSKIVDWFNNLDPKTQRIITLTLAFGFALATVSGIILLVVGGIAAFAAAAAVAGSALWIALGAMVAVGAAFAGLGVAIYLAWQKSAGFRKIVQDTGKDLEKLWKEYIIPTALALKQAWEQFMAPALHALADVIEQRVSPVLHTIIDFMRSEAIERFKEAGNIIKDILIWAMSKLSDIIKNNVIPIIQKLTAYYHEHEATIKLLIHWIGEIGKWLGIIVAIIIGSVVVAFIGAFVGAIMAVVGAVIVLVNVFVDLIEWGKRAWHWVQDSVTNTGKAIHDFVVGFRQAGADLINGFIEGVRSRFDEARNAITNFGTNVLSWFRNRLGIGSPSKVFMEYGRMSAKGYMLGLQDAVPAMQAQVSNMVGSVSSVASPYNGANNTTYNQSIMIQTQQISPRRQAAELGWLLAGRS